MQVGAGALDAMRNLPQRLGVVINYRLLTGREIGSQFLRELESSEATICFPPPSISSRAAKLMGEGT